jgi:hypothetical protein
MERRYWPDGTSEGEAKGDLGRPRLLGSDAAATANAEPRQPRPLRVCGFSGRANSDLYSCHCISLTVAALDGESSLQLTSDGARRSQGGRIEAAAPSSPSFPTLAHAVGT